MAAAFAPLTPAVRMMPSGSASTAAGDRPSANSFKKRPWIVDAAVLALPEGIMRTAGVSGAKAAAITDLARKVQDGTVPLDAVDSFSDDELVAHLVQVRGIGRWTAEMFLIFQLRRLDVWPVDDYGIRKGWALAHKLKDLPAPRALQAEGDLFQPYRTIAAWYCWRAVDTVLPITRGR
jgi:DNA-3-methyladenine glycosylase II